MKKHLPYNIPTAMMSLKKNNLITIETENMKIFNFVSGINEFISCGRADILMDYVNSQKKIPTHDKSFVNAILDVKNSTASKFGTIRYYEDEVFFGLLPD